MPRQISYETANRLAAVWDQAESVRDAFERIEITGDIRKLYRYRRQAEEMLGFQLRTINSRNADSFPRMAERFELDHEYTVVIFTDAHFWPHETGPAYYGLLEILEELQPEVVINNGDSFDCASISRHPPNGWENPPTLREELDANRDHLDMIREASGDAELYWCEGNHDKRFENYLAKNAPGFKDLPGTSLEHLFPEWVLCNSLVLNNEFIVKHRWHNGQHANWNNVLKGGKSIATGHTHRLNVRPYTDYSGTRYGVECGTLADPHSEAFRYTEDNPLDWQQGFVVLDIHDEVHIELAKVCGNGKTRFRGSYYG